jgi:acetyl esterase/lipase
MKYALARLLLPILAAAAMGSPAAAEEVTEGVVYGRGYAAPSGETQSLRDLLLDVYHPPERFDGPRPAAVLIHGGSFRKGERTHRELTRLARYLARHGYVCFSIDYRLMGDNPPAPGIWGMTLVQAAIHAAFVDAKTAVRHVRANAVKYGVDPERVAVIGDSAGAFAALAAGISEAGDFAGDGPEFPVPPENNPDVNAKPAAVVNLWGSAELIRDLFTPDDPPILIVHGTNDGQVGTNFQVALNIVSACEKHGIPHEFHPIEGGGHGAWNANIGGKTINELVLDFLNRKLVREGI